MPEIRPPFRRVPDSEVFAVSGDIVQVTARGLDGPVEVTCGSEVVGVDDHCGAVVVELAGLAAATTHEVRITDDTGLRRLEATTAADIGPVRSRFATISDLHLGSDAFGRLGRVHGSSSTSYSLRCAKAALREAEDWGAELLLIKGDLTDCGRLSDWDEVFELVEAAKIPVLVTPGNHDVFTKIEIEAPIAIEKLGLGYEPLHCVDLDGVRVLLADTTRTGRGTGTLAPRRDELVEAAGQTRSPVFVAIHHNIQRTPVTWFWPPGIPSGDASPVVADIAEANESVFITSGHTHRHRRHRLGPSGRVLFTEVGSTSDYPGTWAGYEVSDTAIRQIVRRIADPAVIDWTERTRSVVGGVWPMWSQGRLDDRCVDLELPH